MEYHKVFLVGLIFAGLCSGAPPQNSLRVVNGSDAILAEFPYMASLRSRTGAHTCGATFILADYLITAAHCIFSSKAEDYSVQYGTNEISRDGNYVSMVQRVIVHQGYEENNNFIHDIALIKLVEPVVFDRFVHAVTLPDYMEFIGGGEAGQLIGWGYNDSSMGVLQSWLQKVDLLTMTDNECRLKHINKVHTTNICAGVQEGGKGQCTGDSGGPLIVDGKQVGIVSWSVKPCTLVGYPGVYTELTYYIGWIREHTGVDSLGRRGST